MNTPENDPAAGRLSDDELDAILASTHDELLHYAGPPDSSALVLALMADDDESKAAPATTSVSAHAVTHIIDLRRRGLDLARAIDIDVDIARTRVSDIARDID